MRERLGPTAVGEFLDRACDRHGGLETFELTPRLSLVLAEFGGAVPWLKGVGRRFAAPRAVDLWPHQCRAVFYDYPGQDRVAIYDHGCVAITDDPDLQLEGPTHRATFAGIAKWRTWWPEDAVYFLGYALLLYVSLPYALRAQRLMSAWRRPDGVELWYRFADGADTHSAVQGFYFDESGLLVRHDYRAEILGAMFNGAHFSADYTAIAGLQLATRRTVYAKPWHYPVRAHLPVPVLTARLSPRPPDELPARPGQPPDGGGSPRDPDDGPATAPVTPRSPTGPRRSASRSYVDS
jgi:hypothetical protein